MAAGRPRIVSVRGPSAAGELLHSASQQAGQGQSLQPVSQNPAANQQGNVLQPQTIPALALQLSLAQSQQTPPIPGSQTQPPGAQTTQAPAPAKPRVVFSSQQPARDASRAIREQASRDILPMQPRLENPIQLPGHFEEKKPEEKPWNLQNAPYRLKSLLNRLQGKDKPI